MQDIAELERRITAAMERITKQVETLSTADAGAEGPVGALEEVARLNEALDEERMAKAQLNEELRKLRTASVAAGAADDGAALAEAQAKLAAQIDEIATLRRVLAEAGREIASLRAARSAEAEELAQIVTALDPLVSAASAEVPHA